MWRGPVYSGAMEERRIQVHLPYDGYQRADATPSLSIATTATGGDAGAVMEIARCDELGQALCHIAATCSSSARFWSHREERVNVLRYGSLPCAGRTWVKCVTSARRLQGDAHAT